MVNAPHIIILDENPDSFPPVTWAHQDPNGLLAAGGDLTTDRLLAAYRRGIFPWYNPDQPILWWSPDPRAILFLDQIQISRSLRKTLKKTAQYQVTFDHAFNQVVKACAAPRPTQATTWITDEMQIAYNKLHNRGYAHSLEVWQDKLLVGGLYGVSLGKAFFGESMFNRAPNAAKIALVWLCWQLQAWNFDFIDCQNPSRYLSSMGSKNIPRAQFITMLEKTLQFPDKHGKWQLDTKLKV